MIIVPTQAPREILSSQVMTMSTTSSSELGRAARAADEGDLDELERILRVAPQILQARDSESQTLLILACRAATGNCALPPVPGTPGQHAAVDRILAAGADLSASDDSGFAPLHAAAGTGNLNLGRRLLDAGAPRQGQLMGAKGGSPLAFSLFYAKTEMAHMLADPPVPDNLRTAAGLGRSLDRFIDGDDLSPQAAEGVDFYRPLPIFPEWNRSNSRQELIDEALTWAARNGQCESKATLVEMGADVNANPYRGTPLLWAVYDDRVVAVAWLLDHGADPDLRHDFGGAGHGVSAVAMHLAAQFGSVNCLQLLLERGADSTIKDGAFGGTPLGWAKHSGNEASIALLTH